MGIKNLRLVGIPEHKEIEKIYTRAEIDSSDYVWVKNPVKTYASKSVLVTTMGNSEIENLMLSSMFLELVSNVERLKRVGHKKWNDVMVKNLYPEFEHPVGAMIIKCARFDENGFICR